MSNFIEYGRYSNIQFDAIVTKSTLELDGKVTIEDGEFTLFWYVE